MVAWGAFISEAKTVLQAWVFFFQQMGHVTPRKAFPQHHAKLIQEWRSHRDSINREQAIP